ncbi:MAG TPA: metallophosphoesterase [Terrimicrobiaceae bacterium]
MMDPSEAAGHTDYRKLAQRMGRKVLERRIRKQASLWAREVHQGKGFFMLEGIIPMDTLVWHCLELVGLDQVGKRNFLDVRVVENEVVLPQLPSQFEGFRLMQLADLHLDLDRKLVDVIIERIDGLEYDVAVLTGDYHNKIAQEHDTSLELMGRLVPHIKKPRYAILGNHDFIEKVAFLEAVDLTVLLNECDVFEREGVRLWICGVDDPHFFRTHDLKKARERVPPGETAILLSHSPETYQEAEKLGFAFMLSGHTHGGQLCLPGGFAIIGNAPVPRRFLAGPWGHGSLVGYTSRGTGASGVPARLNCPSEVTIHTLRRSPTT